MLVQIACGVDTALFVPYLFTHVFLHLRNLIYRTTQKVKVVVSNWKGVVTQSVATGNMYTQTCRGHMTHHNNLHGYI